MAESANGGNTPGQPPKELSMEIRLLLAFLLMGAVMFVTPYLPFFKSSQPPPGKAPETASTEPPGGQPAQPGQPSTAAGQPPPSAETAAVSATSAAAATPQDSLPLLSIETD